MRSSNAACRLNRQRTSVCQFETIQRLAEPTNGVPIAIREHLGAHACAAQEQTVQFSKGFWRRRPDLNRGWRFCRFNGVVNRVVSCWSLVCPAPPFYLVLGPYWTTFGLRVPLLRHLAIVSLSHRIQRCLAPTSLVPALVTLRMRTTTLWASFSCSSFAKQRCNAEPRRSRSRASADGSSVLLAGHSVTMPI
jgi:hypothetical protein